MATWIKIPDFPEAMANKIHKLDTDVLKIALSNTTPGTSITSGGGILANAAEISYANYGDTLAVDRVLEGVVSVETAGTWKLDANDFTITAVGGALAAFRYLYIYNDTQTAPVKPLIGIIDQGASITLLVGESAVVTFAATGIVTIL